MNYRISVNLLFVGAILLAGCSQGPATSDLASATNSDTQIPPTETQVPLAALVNGDEITLADYELEVARFEEAFTASGTDLATLAEYRTRILEGMIDLILLAQDARANGFVVDDVTLGGKVADISESLGGMEHLNTWLSENSYSLDQFKLSLANELLAAETTNQIIKDLPETTEHVHARHILLSTRADAEWVLGQLRSGVDFKELARSYSIDGSTAASGGDLGWIPEGYLPWPVLDDALFSLDPGTTGEIIETALGFHVLQVVEKDDRRLSFDAMQMRRERAVESWLEDRRAASDIQVFITP